MKTLIFADTHLTNKYDPNLADYIAKLVKSVDQVIINGDFWDLYLTTFDRFINSEWSKLFPILQPKTVYLYGNHDPAELMDERVKLFSKLQADNYQFVAGERTFQVEHGHRVAAEFNDAHPLISKLVTKYFPQFYPTLDSWYLRQDLLGKIWRGYTSTRAKNLQNQLRRYAYCHRKKNVVRVFAHSHLPAHEEIDQGFICLGASRFGKFRHLIIDEQSLKFVVSNYHSYTSKGDLARNLAH